MIVEGLDGVFVFGRDGNLVCLSDSHETVLFSRKITDELKSPVKTMKSVMNALRSGERNANRIKSAAKITMDERSVSVSLPNGTVISVKTEGAKHVNMDCVKATVEALRTYYAEAYDQQNGVMLDNGYRPLGHRDLYFPHLRRLESGIQSFIDMLEVEALPTAINGLTANFKPGRPWASHLLKREGPTTEYDAIRGFNKYVSSAGDLIFNTPVTQRIRQLENALRDKSAPGSTQNSNFAAWLHEYANEWANKKAEFDRGAESLGGREVYQVSKSLTGLFSSSAVGGNVSSAMSNCISYLTAVPNIEAKHAAKETVRTAAQLMQLMKKDGQYDGFADKIPFLQRRFADMDAIAVRASDHLKQKGSKALYAFFSASTR